MLTYLDIKGFKSIESQSITFGKINVLIGANGAGKSNLFSFFRMLASMASGNLQEYIRRAGGADDLLYYGSRVTRQIESTLIFDTDIGAVTHHFRMGYAGHNTLFFEDEKFSADSDIENRQSVSDREESALAELPPISGSAEAVKKIIERCRTFQFHDTSETARVRQHGYIYDNQYLKSNAENLAAYLYMLRETAHPYYSRIVLTIRQVMPFFHDFVLSPEKLNENKIILNWKEKSSDMVFGPHQLPDGGLRIMAIVTLFLQPEHELPKIILIDEPEIGLHPYAIETLASLTRHAAPHSQMIIATQSTELLDYFEPDEIILAERPDKKTLFRRCGNEEFKDWLKEYSVSELWKKNVLGIP